MAVALSARASLRRAHADGRPKQGEWIILLLAPWLRGFSFFYFFYICELAVCWAAGSGCCGFWCGWGNSPKRRAFIRGRAASLRVCGGRDAWVVGERDMWGMFRVGPEMSVR